MSLLDDFCQSNLPARTFVSQVTQLGLNLALVSWLNVHEACQKGSVEKKAKQNADYVMKMVEVTTCVL